MAKYLVIVESPAKVKTIKKFLGTLCRAASFITSTSGKHRSRSEEKANFWQISERLPKKQIRFISQLTLTVREKQFPGI